MGKPHLSSKQRRQKEKHGGTDATRSPSPNENNVWTSANNTRENREWEEYYRRQKVVPETEWDAFMASLRSDLPIAFRVLICTPHQHYIREEIARTRALLKEADTESCTATSPAAADSRSCLTLGAAASSSITPARGGDPDSIPPATTADSGNNSPTAAVADCRSHSATTAAPDVGSSSAAAECGSAAASMSRDTTAGVGRNGELAQTEEKKVGTAEGRESHGSEAAPFKIGDVQRAAAAACEAPPQQEEQAGTEQRVFKQTDERLVRQRAAYLTCSTAAKQPAAVAAAAIRSPVDASTNAIAADKGVDAFGGARAGAAGRRGAATAAGTDKVDGASDSAQVSPSACTAPSREFAAAPGEDAAAAVAAPAVAVPAAAAPPTSKAGLRSSETNLVNCFKALSWYLQGSEAYQIEVSRATLRSCRLLSGFHRFLVSESEAGTIVRQEVVSMVPVMFFDIQAGSYVLDMCAAPGSKTSQLLERMHVAHQKQQQQRKTRVAANAASHSTLRPSVPWLPPSVISTATSIDDIIPPGMVVANDADAGRAHMLIHRLKHLHSPCLVVVSHSAEFFPSLFLPARNDDASAVYNGVVEQNEAEAKADRDTPAEAEVGSGRGPAGTGGEAAGEAHSAAAALTENLEQRSAGTSGTVEAALAPSKETAVGTAAAIEATVNGVTATVEAKEKTAAQSRVSARTLKSGEAVCGEQSSSATAEASAQTNSGGRIGNFGRMIHAQQPPLGNITSSKGHTNNPDDHHSTDAQSSSVPHVRRSATAGSGSPSKRGGVSPSAASSCCYVENKWTAETNDSPCKPGVLEPLQYDCVLCDVPCTADGTLRKSPMLWARWHPNHALGCHRLQLRILLRGITLCRVGGRIVYSTCSFNPLENEAVVAAALVKMKGAVQLVDCSSYFPSLNRRPGLSTWQVKAQGKWYSRFEEVPESVRRRLKLRVTAFPPCQGEIHTERGTAGPVRDSSSSSFTRCSDGHPATCNSSRDGDACNRGDSTMEGSCSSTGNLEKGSKNSSLFCYSSSAPGNSTAGERELGTVPVDEKSRCCENSSAHVCNTLSSRAGSAACDEKDSRRRHSSSGSRCGCDCIRDGSKDASRKNAEATSSSQSCKEELPTWGDIVKDEAQQRDGCSSVCNCSSRSTESCSTGKDRRSRDKDDSSGDDGDGRDYLAKSEAHAVDVPESEGKPPSAPYGDTHGADGVLTDASPLPLHHCMRFLPHLNNTGGFFVAVFHKIHQGPRRLRRVQAADADFMENHLSERTDAGEGVQGSLAGKKREAKGVTDEGSEEDEMRYTCNCRQRTQVATDGAECAGEGGSRHFPREEGDAAGYKRESLATGDPQNSAGGSNLGGRNEIAPGVYKETQPHKVRSPATERTAGGDVQRPMQVQLDFVGLGWKDTHIRLQHEQHLQKLAHNVPRQEERRDCKEEHGPFLRQDDGTIEQPQLDTLAEQQEIRGRISARTAGEARKEASTNRQRLMAAVTEPQENYRKDASCLHSRQPPHAVEGHTASRSLGNRTGSPSAAAVQPCTVAPSGAPSVQACYLRQEKLEATWRAACASLGLRNAIRPSEKLNESACTHAKVAAEELVIARRLLEALRGCSYVRKVEVKPAPRGDTCGMSANPFEASTAGQTLTRIITGPSARGQHNIQKSVAGVPLEVGAQFSQEDHTGLRDRCPSDQLGDDNECGGRRAGSRCHGQLVDNEALLRVICLVSSGVDRALRGVSYSRYKIISAGCVTFQCRGSRVYRVGYGGAQWAVPVAMQIHHAQHRAELQHAQQNCVTRTDGGLSVSAQERKEILRAKGLLAQEHSRLQDGVQVTKQRQWAVTQLRDPSVLLYVDQKAMEIFLKAQPNKTRVEWAEVEHLPGAEELREHAPEGPLLLITESAEDCTLVAPAWKGKTQLELMIDKHTRAALLRLLVKSSTEDA